MAGPAAGDRVGSGIAPEHSSFRSPGAVKTTPADDEAFWGWPGWRLLGKRVLLGSCQVLWFFFIYGGANYVTKLHSRRVRLHFDWELHVPFVPVMVLGYMSVYPLFVMAPFVLRSLRKVVSLVLTLATI